MTETTLDQVLNALDDAPQGRILFLGEATVDRPLRTIAELASDLGVSRGTARRAVLTLLDKGLVEAWTALGASTRRRQIYVSGQAA